GSWLQALDREDVIECSFMHSPEGEMLSSFRRSLRGDVIEGAAQLQGNEESGLSAVQLLTNMLVKGINDEDMADRMATVYCESDEDGDCLYESAVDFHASMSHRNEHLTNDGISPTNRTRRGTL
ncbi:hypothetical protein CYMTET_22802, partial [Cymbomonas tetramitiformis]